MLTWIVVASGGALGCMARHAVNRLVHQHWPLMRFPAATVIVERPERPSALAVMSAVPLASAVASPLDETLTAVGFDDAQATVVATGFPAASRAVAVS